MESQLGEFSISYRTSLRPATQLLNDIVQVSKEYQARLCRTFGINATDMAVVEQLMLGGPQSPGDMARNLSLSAAAMTTAVDRLVSTGHVTRSQHLTDRRGVVVTATPAAIERALNQVLPVAVAVDAVLDEFDADQQDAITRYLGRVAEVHREGFPD